MHAISECITLSQTDAHLADFIEPGLAGGTASNIHADPGPVAFFDPNLGGGSMLNRVSTGGGEPLNVSQSVLRSVTTVDHPALKVIISGLSSPAVLTDAGFLNYARSLNL
jgi:hypothetical protein